MADTNQIQAPPLLVQAALNPPPSQPRTFALYAIVAYKFVKGLALVLLGLGFLLIPAAEMRAQILETLRQANFDVTTASEASGWIQMLTPENLHWLTIGSVLYGSFSWAEGIGLLYRAAWAAWITIGESAMFVPVEVWQLERSFSIWVLVILVLNVAIVWYLFRNRRRLFYSFSAGQAIQPAQVASLG